MQNELRVKRTFNKPKLILSRCHLTQPPQELLVK